MANIDRSVASHAGPQEMTSRVPHDLVPKKNAQTSAKAPKWLGLVAAHGILIVMSAFSVFPVWWVLTMAFDRDAASGVLRWFPAHFAVDAFANVIAHPTEIDGITFWQLLWNSMLLSVGTTVIGIVLGATAAYAFSRFRFPGREAGLMSFLVLQMFPAVASIAPLYVLLSSLHIRTSLFGLAIAYAAGTLPFAIWNLKGYFDTVPKDLEEAALIDGCSQTTAFLKIILPLSTPAIAVTALFGFMTGWTEIVLAWTMLENPKTFTLAMALYGMVGQYSTTKPWNEFAAMSIIISLPVVIVMLLLQRFIVGGLTNGAVKG
jgi:arabinogalactan oligomer/maltooligosaccharide transport system permease protein